MRRSPTWPVVSLMLAVLLAGCGQVRTRPPNTPQPPEPATATATAVMARLPTATSRPQATVPSPTPTETPTPVIYRIQAGENLYVIAARFGVPHDLLRDVNNIENERALQIGQALLIPLGGETGPAAPTATATATPLPMAVDNVSFHPNPLGEVAVLGELHNLSAVDLEQMLVRITLFDPDDQPVASAEAYPVVDVAAPNQRVPFVVRFQQPPAPVASYQAEVLSALPAYLGSLHRELEPRSLVSRQEESGLWRLQGRLMNTGVEEAVDVVATVVLYDPLGRVVGVRSVYPEPTTIARGGEADFRAEIAPAGPVASFAVIAQGRRLAAPTPAPADLQEGN